MKRLLLSIIAAAFALISVAQKNPSQVSALLERIGGEGTSSRIETKVKRSLSMENPVDIAYELYNKYFSH